MGTFCDPFGGIGSVGSYFQSKGYNVTSGDILLFPYFFQIARLKFDNTYFQLLTKQLGLKDMADIVLYINSIKPKDGWFVTEYAHNRMFFTVENARQIQAVRQLINKWDRNHLISENERAVLLASLINSMDKVANTAGTYYAHLKQWNRKALTSFKYEFVDIAKPRISGQCYNEHALSLINKDSYDIVYLDPPYNGRSYPHYYHLPETIAMGATPKVHGASGIPRNIKNNSGFNYKSNAITAFKEIIYRAKFKLLVFHYADDGVIAPSSVVEVLTSIGKVKDFVLDSKGYTTLSNSKQTKHHLYLVEHVN
jgi:adenine-specific DNA-methyltransferase